MALSNCQLPHNDPLVVISNCSSQHLPVKVREMQFSGNTNINGTTAIRVSSGCFLQLENSAFQENAGGTGAVLDIRINATVLVSKTIFKDNRSSFKGGAIELHNADLSIIDSSFDGNTAAAAGGAIFAEVRFDLILCIHAQLRRECEDMVV